MDLQQLIQLKSKGLSNRKIAGALGVSRNTVNTYVRALANHELTYEQLREYPEAKLAGLFPQTDSKDKSRYEQLAGCFPDFSKELRKTGCTLQALWRRYQADHPGGYGYTQFVHHFNQWKGQTKASGILRHQAGQKLFIDFTGKTLSWVDRQSGQVHPAQVFVGILPCSQYTYVQATENQKREQVVRALAECLEWLGGVPEAIVADNMKAVVAKGHKYAPLINKTLSDFALHYQCVIDPTRPYHPKDKALVEGTVNLVYQRIFYPLSEQTFFGVGQINKAIAELLGPYNDYRFYNRPTTRRRQFLEIEQPKLNPLPLAPYQLRYFKRAKVQKISHIYLGADKNYYSVPHRYVGRHVEVQYTHDIVEVFYGGERIAHHPRSRTCGAYTTIGAHMPPAHQAYVNWNPEGFAKRAARIGPYTKSYIRRLMGQYTYPEIAYKQAQGILALTKFYPSERLEAACQRAAKAHKASYRTINSILKNNLDQQKQAELPLENHIPDHDNIRGDNHYQ